ncbi:aldo/keto reductase [Abyssisolibacter fermentans]|uniref:aldo/keto reductase n=1 Tax=Abyssisolibacter fermentans TaxID=1766203 RepID=UPI00083463AD|nr:aldo/keto reductase [Abyssisolibacter fermentans]
MEYEVLGSCDFKVSKMCFGSLTMSPLQANMSFKEGAALIKYAYEKGVNFLDTAEFYDNYGHIREALKSINRHDYIIATKSYSYSKETAQKSLKKALEELDTDYIDIFLLHEQESEHTIRGHYEAIEYFMKAKEKGIIRAIGISTHRVEGVKAFNKYSELDVVHPIINIDGIGIQDGSVQDMLDAIKEARLLNRGIYAMKPLGGGHLIRNVEEALAFVRSIKDIHSFAIGMQCQDEIDANVSYVETGQIDNNLKSKLINKKRRLHIDDWCEGCGTCVEVCQHNGIMIKDNKAVPILENCVFCGYCSKHCPQFCIKVV